MKKSQRDMTACLAAAALAGVAGLASSAFATGPDVLVGDLPDVTHWGSGVNTNGVTVDAYSVGTTSCNRGDTPLEWITTAPNANRHPVIGENMYRLDMTKGRFEQLGQSWLKQSFTALQGTVCFSDCQPYANGTHLGIHCSDPYGSGLNGDQSRLSTKSEVNASSGFYPIPFGAGTQGTSSATVWKRLQVLRSDLQTPNSLYFVSGQYVNGDDAEAHNNNNNESYRRVTINQSSFDATPVDTTKREIPAIYAWHDYGLGVNTPDAGVTIVTVDVIGDGRFLVGNKVINLGNGMYRYEYAVENLNSDRSGGSFTIPMPSNGTVVTSGPDAPYFHGVPYHSGDPYSNADWNVSVSSSGITFSSPQTYQQNVNSNALRWGTMYNFAFVCNVPPSGGAASIHLFKPPTAGSPITDATFGTIIPSPDGQFHPLNDSCTSAQGVQAGTTNFSNMNATTDGPAECNVNGYAQIDNDVWFVWGNNSACTNPMTITTCGSDFNTKLAVYSACPTGPGTAIACSDDAPSACGTGTLNSAVTFNPAPNATYLIRVGGYQGAMGNGVLNITAPYCPPPPGPVNDSCSNPLPLADGMTYSESTGTTANHVAATNDYAANCGTTSTSPDVWFSYTPQTTGTVAIDTCGSTLDTVIQLYTGSCGSLVSVNNSCNDDNGGAGPCGSAQPRTSYRSLTLNAGTTYLIRMAGYNGATGAYSIHIVGGNGVLPPSNDACSNATAITAPATNFSTLGASTDGPTHNACNFNGSNQITNDIWYTYTPTQSGTLTADTCSSATNFNTKMALYTDALCTNFDQRLVACSDDDASCGSGRSRVTTHVNAGQTYLLRVGGFNGASGSGVLNVNVVPDAPACDPDVNQDGVADQGDVDYLINVVAGGANPTGIDPDFNQDGVSDQGDIDALINVVAGGPCP
ncbi:MAG: hypothetical protein GC200_03435 [Tepidisphaera sp.]|nr:hypothetical protein [Tepidisphaera sp.]